MRHSRELLRLSTADVEVASRIRRREQIPLLVREGINGEFACLQLVRRSGGNLRRRGIAPLRRVVVLLAELESYAVRGIHRSFLPVTRPTIGRREDGAQERREPARAGSRR